VSLEPKRIKTCIPQKLQHHIQDLSNQMGLQIGQTMETWQMKLQELESNLSMITNTIPNDSYDDIKLIVSNIMANAQWLTGNCRDDIATIVPNWKFAETSLQNLLLFIRIVEDMKSFSSSIIADGDLKDDIEERMKILEDKRVLYGDLLRQDCIAWTILGYPVQELRPIITKFQESIFRLNHSIIERTQNAIEWNSEENGLGFWERPLILILEAIQLITESVQLIGRCSVTEVLQKHAANMSLLFLNKTLDIFRMLLKTHKNSKFPDAKVCFLFENVIQLFELAYLYQLSQDAPLMDVVSSTTTSCSSIMVPESTTEWFVSPLYHPAIEAGLELCTYAGSRSHEGMQDVIMHLCAKYIYALGELMEPVLDSHVKINTLLQ
jgi:hypothetical protein